MAQESEATVKVLARRELDLERVIEALGLLGVNPCRWCNRFFRRTDPGALLDAGELICYGCIPEWWPERSAQLGAKERENVEGKLVFWLREHHRAELFKDPAKLPDPSQQELHLVANCLECHGTGKSLGDDGCKYCADRGTVWVIVERNI